MKGIGEAGGRISPLEPDATSTTAPGGTSPYEAPRILSREPLEGVAAVCTGPPSPKASLATCPQGPISS